ncbi:MAG TPA: T9SS type A sorting domain-containing protein [Flavobacteriales bacterium]|nr:T9SS type A sorting domain-containing protein [Flavobacteriales bacterium]
MGKGQATLQCYNEFTESAGKNMKSKFKKHCFLLILMASSLSLDAQNYGKLLTVELSATIQASPASITLIWEDNQNTVPDTYLIWRKLKGAQGWGNSIASFPSSTLSFTDNSVSSGVSYEYHVQLRDGNTIYAWGYINAGIKLDLSPNKGDLLILIDSTFGTTLETEISQLESDLHNDGWNHTRIAVNPNNTPQNVKAMITNQYNSLPDLKAVYLFGHIPVPYSGNLYPDGHADHEGAWPADVYYADMDGVWTDNSVNNTIASSSRNQNIPGDGKFDQSTVPSALELEVCRVDFNNLTTFSLSEEALLAQYLTKAHDFKTGQYIPQEKGLIDQGNISTFPDGFAQNGYRNFNSFFGPAGVVDSLDYFTTLVSSSYLWSYGCGAGAYNSAQGLNNGARMYSSDLSSNDILATFTMLFGSYFGDWDSGDNLLRSTLASGKTLAVSWAGRPNFHYHNMAMGTHLGYAAKISQEKNSDYMSIDYGGGFVTGEGVHVAQFGDPSLRMYYLRPPSDLLVTDISNAADLQWVASLDSSIDGYNVYRKLLPDGIWGKANSAILTDTLFSDPAVLYAGDYEYMVKAVKLKLNSSGSFYNESLGTTDSITIAPVPNALAVMLFEEQVKVFPNPTFGEISVYSSVNIEQVTITDIMGREVLNLLPAEKRINLDLYQLRKGLYIASVKCEKDVYRTIKIVLH